MNALTPEQITQFQTDLTELHSSWPNFKDLPDTVRQLQDRADQAEQHLLSLRRSALLPTRATARAPRLQVNDDLAAFLGSIYVTHCATSGTLEALSSSSTHRDALLQSARSYLKLTTRAALTTTDIPLPSQFGSDLRELVSAFGVVRSRMTPYPIGLGTARPPRMGTRPAFGAIAMSALVPEKSPSFTFASLESHKIGGSIKMPREIDEQSIVPMGRFIARYAAVEFARTEDNFAFLADGTGSYESISGIVQVAKDAGNTVILAAGKTHPSDATLDDLRALRRKVNKAALSGRLSAYYLDSTWETRLPAFRTQSEPNVYQRLPDGTAVLDGYPIVWTDVLQPYDTAATPNKCLAVFGALSFWWMGEHGHPRIDTSIHVYFDNDQLAVRCIEEIDFDYCAQDATAALITAAA